MHCAYNWLLRMGQSKKEIPFSAARAGQALSGWALECFQGEERFVILTTAPNDTIVHIHDRMPVLLTDDELMPWLHDTGMASAKLTALLPALEGIAV